MNRIDDDPVTAAVVLAAGMSRRMGRLKMLLPFGDRPMLGRVIESLQSSGVISHIAVVTGYAEQEIRDVTAEYSGVVCIHNACFANGGMLSSVKAGVAALTESTTAFFLVLGDQPMVRPDTLRAMHAKALADGPLIVTPRCNGKRGHPVLISCRISREILSLGESETLRTLMERHSARISEVAVDDPATILDIDTPADYEAALTRWRALRRTM